MTQRTVNSNEFVKLEHALIDANYLGLALREFGRNENFACAEATAFVADLLIGWARLVGQRMRDGDKMFFYSEDTRAKARAKAGAKAGAQTRAKTIERAEPG